MAHAGVRTAEIVATLSLATDLGMGLPLEHGLESTVFAMRLAERLGVPRDVAAQTYYGCLLFYAGCTADVETNAELFDDGVLLRNFNPVMFARPTQTVAGIVRALAASAHTPYTGPVRVATHLPKAVRGHQAHVKAMCEVAQMLADRLGLRPLLGDMFLHLTDRWDGRGPTPGLSGGDTPFALRLIHVARDAALQRLIGGWEHAAAVIHDRAGAAFDPEVAACLVSDAEAILRLDETPPVWEELMSREPAPVRIDDGGGIDGSLAAIGDFADLPSRYLVGHSAAVAALAGAAAAVSGLSDDEVDLARRAGSVHDVGRVAVSTTIWQKQSPLRSDDREQIRLHAYHTERCLSRSPSLSALAAVAGSHHERLDGSGYHRGVTAAALPPLAPLLAAADVYVAMTQPRPHRPALDAASAARELREEARAGRLHAPSAAAVLEAAGHARTPVVYPAGLTAREAEVVSLLARGLQTKQIARTLGISVKTADRHIQHAYAKTGVSTRAAITMFAMQHGLATWGELPISDRPARS